MRENFQVRATAIRTRRRIERELRLHKTAPRIERAALLVLDLQRWFFEPGAPAFIPSAGQILEPVMKLAELFLRRKRLVIFSQQINAPVSRMNSWWRHRLDSDDRLAELFSPLPAGASLLVKPEYDTFLETGLEQLLRSSDTERVFVCGVMTHLCCETTARAAFTRGFEAHLVIDATTTYNPLFYRNTLINLSHGFAFLPTAREIVAANEI